MLFKEIEDCDNCPFSYENSENYLSDFKCPRHPDYYLPCTDEKLSDLTVKEAVTRVNLGCQRQHESKLEYDKFLKKKEQDKKEAVEKGLITRGVNRKINSDIALLRSQIKKRESAIRDIETVKTVLGVTNEMFQLESKSDKDVTQVIERLKMAIALDKKRLEELLIERDRRNKMRRKTKR